MRTTIKELAKRHNFRIIDEIRRDDYFTYYKIEYNESVIEKLREERAIVRQALKEGAWSVCDAHPLGYLTYIHANSNPNYPHRGWWYNDGTTTSDRRMIKELIRIGARILTVKFR